jgi:prefoldin subunit 5
MQDRIERRLDELKHEHEVGQRRLHEMEAQQAQLRETLLRISGAILALEELRTPPADEGNGAAPPNRVAGALTA